VWTGRIWFKIGSCWLGCCEDGNDISGSTKKDTFLSSWVTREEPIFVELVNYNREKFLLFTD
jgi:hypothetical protein